MPLDANLIVNSRLMPFVNCPPHSQLNVSIDRKRGGNLDEVHKFIEETFPEEDVSDSKEYLPVKKRCNDIFGTQLKYILNRDKVTLWKVFDAFENNKERLKISDWAITETTLEEVFLQKKRFDSPAPSGMKYD